MQSSLIDRIFPPSSPLLPRHNHRDPRSPSSSTSYSPAERPRSPPAPDSSILRPAPFSLPLTHHSDPLLPINRASKSLQRTIQSLLDAQSEGLLAGLSSSNDQENVSSNGSLTPTPTMSSTTTFRKPATVPVRQPPAKKISLRAARRGLSRSMHDFAALKHEEERILDQQIQQREDALDQVGAFTTKQEALQAQISSITYESGAQSANHVRAEANNLDVQIRVLEDKLFEMKARHRHLMDQVQQLESSVQSKLSSYNASLDLIDKDIKRFLAQPPIAQPSSPNGASGPQSFHSLHPKRRTLSLASEHWRAEREVLTRQKEANKHEQTALKDGNRVWLEVVTEIQAFERHLRTQMQKLSHDSISQHERDEEMIDVLSRMDRTMQLLEQRLQEADEKGWKLLLCCIGAEFEACREGREILLEASGLADIGETEADRLLDLQQEHATAASAPPDSPDEAFPHQPEQNENDPPHRSKDDSGPGTASAISSNPEPAADSSHTHTDRDNPPSQPQTTRSESRSESEDDDPGPDFLISHS